MSPPEAPSARDRVPLPYLFVTAASSSGSTLLAFLLNAHPRMATVSEGHRLRLVNLDRYRCSCGQRVLDCPFFNTLKARVEELGQPFDLRDWGTDFALSRNRYVNILLARDIPLPSLEPFRDTLVAHAPYLGRRLATIRARNVVWARALRDVAGATVVVDVQKDPSRVRHLARIPEFDLHVLHLVRDVRANVASTLQHRHARSLPTAVRYWIRTNDRADRSRRHLSASRWMRITYEELCAHPQATVDAIARFVGLEPAPLPTSFYEVEHHIIGNRMRKGGTGTVRPDTAWRTRLTPVQLDAIERRAGRFASAFPSELPKRSAGLR